jgi:F0F1-type ATP synthase assembly protein I
MKDEDDEFLTEDEQFEKDKKDGFYQPDPNPETQAEANRKSGLAYGAVTVLIGGILLFLAVGWGVDRYFNTSPWGIVIGIILGAVVGFYQFIRISKQID